MTKIPLFLETTKSFQNKIPTYVRTGSILSYLKSYILNIPSKISNRKSALTIRLLESHFLTSIIGNTIFSVSDKKVSGYGKICCVADISSMSHKHIRFSKRQSSAKPVQHFQKYSNFLNDLLFRIYTTCQKSKTPLLLYHLNLKMVK